MADIIGAKPSRTLRQGVVGVVIQARMTSSRFPGKSMALLHGKPVLQHVVDAVLKMKPLNKKVIVAVPDTEASEPMLEFLADKYSKKRVDNFCGSEFNVLERYYHAAKHFGLSTIVRITADCPFINPKVCTEVLGMHFLEGYDYTSNVFPERTFPQGYDCEVFSFDCLEATYIKVMEDANSMSIRLIGDSSYDQEHVTPFMQRSPHIKRGLIKQKDNHSHINLCVDTPEDLERLHKYNK